MGRINSILFYSEKCGAEDGVRNGQEKVEERNPKLFQQPNGKNQ